MSRSSPPVRRWLRGSPTTSEAGDAVTRDFSSSRYSAAIGGIAKAHDKSPAQVMLRWGIQRGRSVIPKSTKPSRIAENIDVFDFELSADEMAAIDGLDTGRRGGLEPDAITLEVFGREIPEAWSRLLSPAAGTCGFLLLRRPVLRLLRCQPAVTGGRAATTGS